MAANNLSPKQKKFAELYAQSGNGAQSAIGAGYSTNGAKQQAKRLLTYADLQEYLRSITSPDTDSRIASATDRQEFWTTVMQDDDNEMKDRLKASELLGKAHQDFVSRHEHSGPDGGEIVTSVRVELVSTKSHTDT